MTTKIARPLVRLAVLAVLAAGLSACSTISDLDPTGLLSDDTPTSPSDQFPADANAAQPADDAITTPDLAALPARPATASTPAQQQQVAQTVTANGTQAQYSADALRAGTEAAAAAPGGAPSQQMLAAAPPTASDAPPTATADAAPTASDAPPSASDAAPTASPAPVRPMGVASAVPAVGPPEPRHVGPEPSAEQVAQAAAMNAAPPSAAAPATAPAMPPPMAVASAAPAPGGEAAVPAVPGAAAMGSRVAMLTPPVITDAQLGFRPSTAPPLDPSIANWVSAPILAHYRQTASQAGSPGQRQAAVGAVPEKPVKGAKVAMGGPDMSGAVVANMDALSGTAAGAIAANYGGVPPTAIVYFAGDGTTLSPAARGQVRTAVAAFKASGGASMIRVVGHASSRTANMPVERHLEAIFEKSQKRANAVAQELIHEGVPADKVNIEAVGDSQPIYYESMPKGEDGNRRAEIFVQG